MNHGCQIVKGAQGSSAAHPAAPTGPTFARFPRLSGFSGSARFSDRPPMSEDLANKSLKLE